jgi:hypothetical protein
MARRKHPARRQGKAMNVKKIHQSGEQAPSEVVLIIRSDGLFYYDVSFRRDESGTIRVRLNDANGILLAGPERLGIAGGWLVDLIEEEPFVGDVTDAAPRDVIPPEKQMGLE